MSKKNLLCRIFGHDWKWCKCRRCGAFRNEDHYWRNCKCAICGRIRDEQHKWKGCICTVCGRRRDEQHNWKYYNCQKCEQEKTRKYPCVGSNEYRNECKREKYQFSVSKKCYRKCENCGRDGVTDHQFTVYEDQCFKQCSLCGYKESLEHKWVHQDGCLEKCSICGEEQESHEYHLISQETSFGTGRCYHVDSSDEIYCLMCKTPNACLQYPQTFRYTYKCIRCGKISVEHGEKRTTGKSGNIYVNDLPEESMEQKE